MQHVEEKELHPREGCPVSTGLRDSSVEVEVDAQLTGSEASMERREHCYFKMQVHFWGGYQQGLALSLLVDL